MIPDHLPILTWGRGDAAAGKSCAMSAIHWMEGGEGDSDMPECVHPVLRRVFIVVNDAPIWADDEHRTRTLWPLMARAIGTAPSGTDRQRKELSVRLAAWCARQVLPLVRVQDRQVCAAALDAAEGWCDGRVSEEEAAAAAAAAAADAAAAANKLALLTGLLDEYDRLTGRTATPAVHLRGLDALVPTVPA